MAQFEGIAILRRRISERTVENAGSNIESHQFMTDIVTTNPLEHSSSPPSPEERSTSEQLLSGLLYGVSLPERLVRSAVGVTAGTAKEIAQFVVPQAFQDSKSYEVAVRNSLNFLLANVGTVSAPTSETPPTPANAARAADAANDPAAGNPGRFRDQRTNRSVWALTPRSCRSTLTTCSSWPCIQTRRALE